MVYHRIVFICKFYFVANHHYSNSIFKFVKALLAKEKYSQGAAELQLKNIASQSFTYKLKEFRTMMSAYS